MAKKKNYENEDGVWRTVGGRRIFIRNGQDLSSAMRESGKFKSSLKKPKIDDERDTLQYKEKNDYINKNKQYEEMKKRVNEQYEKDIEDARMTGNDKLEESAKKARAEQLRDIDRMQKENRKEYDAYKGTKYERQYDSVEDRYNRDKDFRDKLKDIDKKYNDDKLMSKEEYESYASRLSDRDDYARTSYQDYIDETKNVGSIKQVNDSIRNYDGYKKNDKDYYGSQFVEGANTENKYKTGDRVIYNGQEVEIMKTNRDPRYGNEYLVRGDEGNVWVDDHILKPAKENKMTDYERANFHNEEDLKRYQNTKKDIMEYYTEDYGYSGDKRKAFLNQMEAVNYGNDNLYQMGKRLAEGGNYLIYNGDMEEYLTNKGINPYRKGDVFETYIDYMGQYHQEMYKEFFEEYKREHKNSNLSINDFKKWFKQ